MESSAILLPFTASFAISAVPIEFAAKFAVPVTVIVPAIVVLPAIVTLLSNAAVLVTSNVPGISTLLVHSTQVPAVSV